MAEEDTAACGATRGFTAAADMSAFERLASLREQNRDLLKRLRQQAEHLKTLCDPESAVTAGHRARCALSNVKSKEKSRSGTAEAERPDEGWNTSVTCRKVSFQQTLSHPGENSFSNLLKDQGNNRLTGLDGSAENTNPEPAPNTQDSFQHMETGRVVFQSAEREQSFERQRVPPLLGYDWIAGILDVEPVTEHSEQFFNELQTFRRLNREECLQSQSLSPSAATDGAPLSCTLGDPEPRRISDNHQCTFCYRINSRLYATPLESQAACPVCKMPKSKHPHTESEPALIRVSIPRAILQPAHHYRSHRRSSFDPSDSLSLPSHCLSGCSNPLPNTISKMSSLDLRSSVGAGASTGAFSSHSQSTLDVSDSMFPGRGGTDELLNMSRLTRFHFRHQRQNCF
ncbi:migration and invasion inhibitory protein isoform X2 [Denticeps clupeoides]|uniref:migration and invasion inhibitory protein isoform X2 n=1 Tax=Denticeps clupeoides TaxID=299321 RepID=UPI0010A454DC|nr:migration and invasion-inhibitory protein isoform X2 [Denticeps clupeoides]